MESKRDNPIFIFRQRLSNKWASYKLNRLFIYLRMRLMPTKIFAYIPIEDAYCAASLCSRYNSLFSISGIFLTLLEMIWYRKSYVNSINIDVCFFRFPELVEASKEHPTFREFSYYWFIIDSFEEKNGYRTLYFVPKNKEEIFRFIKIRNEVLNNAIKKTFKSLFNG